MDNEIKLLEAAIQKAESDIIIFFVVLAVILVVFIIPLYRMILKDRKEHRASESKRAETEAEAADKRQDKYMERERVIIEVVKENSEVISSLKSIIERDGKTTTASLERIHTRIDEQSKQLTEQSGSIVKMQATLDEVIRKQHTVSDDIKRGFAEVRKNNDRGVPE